MIKIWEFRSKTLVLMKLEEEAVILLGTSKKMRVRRKEIEEKGFFELKKSQKRSLQSLGVIYVVEPSMLRRIENSLFT